MKIIIGLDDDLLLRYNRRGSPLYFTIYWQNNLQYYPQKGWMDFGCVIMSWWTRAVERVSKDGAEQIFSFMDGPYELTARPSRAGTCVLAGGEFHIECTTSDIIRELENALLLTGDHIECLEQNSGELFSELSSVRQTIQYLHSLIE